MTNLFRKSSLFTGLCIFGSSLAIAQAQSPALPGQVKVAGKRLMRDGRPWIPHGFYQIAFEVPPAALPLEKPFWAAAYQGFSAGEYAEMKQQGADSVRLQIAQDGADPENQRFFDQQWLDQAVSAVEDARAAGLTVIISIQDETQTGAAKKAPLPNDATRRVWKELAPIFGRDRGVLFELYNEPQSATAQFNPHQAPTAQQWEAWAGAMNKTLAEVRGLGAVNVIVADGLQQAQQLTGAPELEDPLRQVVYAAHPYANSAEDQTPAVWDQKFGDFAKTKPVLISEWGIGYFCNAQTPASVVNFLAYLQTRGIGLEAGIWDFAPHTFRSLVQGFPHGQFSSFHGADGAPLACNAPNSGPGKTVESWYQTGAPPSKPQ